MVDSILNIFKPSKFWGRADPIGLNVRHVRSTHLWKFTKHKFSANSAATRNVFFQKRTPFRWEAPRPCESGMAVKRPLPAEPLCCMHARSTKSDPAHQVRTGIAKHILATVVKIKDSNVAKQNAALVQHTAKVQHSCSGFWVSMRTMTSKESVGGWKNWKKVNPRGLNTEIEKKILRLKMKSFS